MTACSRRREHLKPQQRVNECAAGWLTAGASSTTTTLSFDSSFARATPKVGPPPSFEIPCRGFACTLGFVSKRDGLATYRVLYLGIWSQVPVFFWGGGGSYVSKRMMRTVFLSRGLSPTPPPSVTTQPTAASNRSTAAFVATKTDGIRLRRAFWRGEAPQSVLGACACASPRRCSCSSLAFIATSGGSKAEDILSRAGLASGAELATQGGTAVCGGGQPSLMHGHHHSAPLGPHVQPRRAVEPGLLRGE